MVPPGMEEMIAANFGLKEKHMARIAAMRMTRGS